MSIAVTSVPTGTYSVDPGHSSVEFAVKHLGIATVKGSFSSFEGTLELDPDLGSARAYGTVDVASLEHPRARARRAPALARLLRRRELAAAALRVHRDPLGQR